MKCHYCGQELKNGEVFCSCCGTRRQPEPRPSVEADIAPVDPFLTESVDEYTVFWEEEPSAPAASVVSAAPESRPAYVPYGAPERESRPKGPLIQLPTERSLAKMVFLGIITLGIYPLAVWCRIVTELNIAASRYDGERTMSVLGAVLLAPVTLGIYPLVWHHDLCRRIGAELKRRQIDYEFGAKTFWLWNVLGMLILAGPFVFTHRLMKAMNLINRDFNVKG